MLRLPNGILPIGRDLDIFTAFLLTAHLAEQARLTLIDIGCPDLLLWLRRQAQGIRRSSSAIQLRTARIENRSAIRSDLQRRDPLAIVSRVVRDLATNEVRRSRNPHVVRTLVVEHPAHDVGTPG